MKNKVLVAGASGLIGVAAIEAFSSAGWDVLGISRRKPILSSGRDFDFIAVDLRDERAARQALSSLADVTHVAYTAIHENAKDLVSGWSNAEQIKVNNAMLHNVIEPLVSESPRSSMCPSSRERRPTVFTFIRLRSRLAKATRAMIMLTFSSTSRTTFATRALSTVSPTPRCVLNSSPDKPRGL